MLRLARHRVRPRPRRGLLRARRRGLRRPRRDRRLERRDRRLRRLDRRVDDAELTAVLRDLRRLCRPEVPVVPRPFARCRRARRRGRPRAGWPPAMSRSSSGRRSSPGSAPSGSRQASGTSPVRSQPIEWERVRTVPYLTERVLCRQPRLAEIGSSPACATSAWTVRAIRAGCRGGAIPARRDCLARRRRYQTLGEDRPHRAPCGGRAEARSALLAEEVATGRLDAAAVRPVLAAAGHQVRRRAPPGRRTDRPRGRGPRPARPRLAQQADRRRACRSPPAPWAATSSTSTPRSASPPAAPRRCSPCVTVSSTPPLPPRPRKDPVIDRCDGNGGRRTAA